MSTSMALEERSRHYYSFTTIYLIQIQSGGLTARQHQINTAIPFVMMLSWLKP